MECKFVLLADAANVSREGKLNITGEFNAVFSDKIPVGWPFLAVVGRLEANAGEGPSHAAQFKLTDDDGQTVFQTPLFPITLAKGAPGTPTRADLVFGIAGLVFPRFGDYAMHLFVDGVQRGAVSVYVRATPNQAAGG